MRVFSTFSLAVMVIVSLCGNALAWGDTGHKIVCDLAFRLAAPDTRAEIRRLIRLDGEFDFFAELLHMARSSSQTRARAFRQSEEKCYRLAG